MGAVTVSFTDTGPDNANSLPFSIDGLDFTVSTNPGGRVDQAPLGLGARGPQGAGNNQEGRRLAGTEFLLFTFSQPILLSSIGFVEFNAGEEIAALLVNGSTDPIVLTLAQQGGEDLGGNDSRQTFSPDALAGVVIQTLQISSSPVDLNGNSGIRIAGFEAEIVPLPAPIVLVLTAFAVLGYWGRRSKAA
ncbi:MAG: hypothetical protein AAGE80_02390 [Pseudomonadota bacterium]